MQEDEISEWVNPEGPHGGIIRDAFVKMDVNFDGEIDFNETSNLKRFPNNEELGQDVDPDEASLAMEQMKEYELLRFQLADKDRDGALSKREFVVFHEGLDAHPQILALYERQHRANLIQGVCCRFTMDVS